MLESTLQPQEHSFGRGVLPLSVHLDRHWDHSCDKLTRTSLVVLLVEAIKNWTAGKRRNKATILQVTESWAGPGNEAKYDPQGNLPLTTIGALDTS